jgi:hypothetical protein
MWGEPAGEKDEEGRGEEGAQNRTEGHDALDDGTVGGLSPPPRQEPVTVEDGGVKIVGGEQPHVYHRVPRKEGANARIETDVEQLWK